MLTHSYSFAFVAMSGLLFSLSEYHFWAYVFLFLAILPTLLYYKNKVKLLLTKLLLLCLVFSLFYFYGDWQEKSAKTRLTGNEQSFYGEMVTEPRITSSNQFSYQFKLNHGEYLQAFTSMDQLVPVYGDVCTFRGKLSIPNEARNPHGFNYKNHLRNNGIHWVVSVNESTLQCETKGKHILSPILGFRKETMGEIMLKGDEDAAGLINALVFGERSFLSEDRVATYQQLGILHLLAVSGLHVGMLSFSLFYLFCRLGLTRERASILLMIILPIYVILAGGAPSVIRSSFMCLLLLFVTLKEWKVKGIDIISLVCLAILIYNPAYIFHLGFQLSFLTSFALLLSNRLFQDGNPVHLTLKVTFIAQLISLPLILFHFFEVSLLTIPVNLIFIPFISMWILPLSYITIILHTLMPPLAMIPFYIVSFSLKVAHWLIDFIASWGWHMIIFGKPSTLMMVLLYCSILFLFIAMENKKIGSIFMSLGMLLLLFFIQLFQPYFQKEATITFLDVGQGDAAVVELPRRKAVYLIDTGGVISWNREENESSVKGPGTRVIEPFLKGKGISKIDALILTHGHEDHVGEACEVASTFKIEKTLYPRGQPISESGLRVLNCLKEKGTELYLVEDGFRWQKGGSVFSVIHPTSKEKEENDRSIVVIAQIEGVSVLFTGDIEEGAERRIVRDYPNLRADILKVAHHGSKTSSTEPFIKKVNPSVAVISAGKNNLYGHPSLEVVERLNQFNAIVKTTSESGAVRIRVKDGVYKLKETVP